MSRFRHIWRWFRYGEIPPDFGLIVGVPYDKGPAMLDAGAVGKLIEEQRERLDVAIRHQEVALTHMQAARKALGT